MGKFWDWLTDGDTNDVRQQAVIEAEKPKAAEPVKAKERGHFAESKADIEESKAADKEWHEREAAAFKAYKPTGPEFKIVQMPAGHFVIMRRYTKRATSAQSDAWMFQWNGGAYHVWADKIAERSVEPVDTYETVKNTDAPIMTKEYGPVYSYRSGSDEYRLTGYADLAFNVFEDAEAYLFRMATPQDHEVGYDFPPLKKRAKPRAKKATQP